MLHQVGPIFRERGHEKYGLFEGQTIDDGHRPAIRIEQLGEWRDEKPPHERPRRLAKFTGRLLSTGEVVKGEIRHFYHFEEEPDTEGISMSFSLDDGR